MLGDMDSGGRIEMKAAFPKDFTNLMLNVKF